MLLWKDVFQSLLLFKFLDYSVALTYWATNSLNRLSQVGTKLGQCLQSYRQTTAAVVVWVAMKTALTLYLKWFYFYLSSTLGRAGLSERFRATQFHYILRNFRSQLHLWETREWFQMRFLHQSLVLEFELQLTTIPKAVNSWKMPLERNDSLYLHHLDRQLSPL